MNTQTHLLLAGALLARPGQRLRNTAIIAGALIPDAAIYFLFFWSKIKQIPESKVWHELYWQEPWQSWTAAGNSIPIYATLLVLGLILLRQAAMAWKIGLFLTFLALAALTHVAGDLPFHVTDAHRHFWPVSDWKFISPISYWHPEHHGQAFGIFETIFGLALAAWLYVRFKSLGVRIVLVLLAVAYIAVPAYFYLVLGGPS